MQNQRYNMQGRRESQIFQDENKENRIEVLELPAQTKETHGFPREKERWDCVSEISFVFLQVSSGLKGKKRKGLNFL